MASHNRTRSKGAFSILSVDTFRSFSRNGAHQGMSSPSSSFTLTGVAPDVDFNRSPSSLSCDPHDQPSPRSPATTLTGLTLTDPEPKRRRPLSWLSLRFRPFSRSSSTHLPKDTSCSTMGRSVISAPILTSTSNSKVAAVESVQYKDHTTAREARRLAGEIEAESVHPRRLVDVLKSKLRKRTAFTKMEEDTCNGMTRRRAETMNLCKDKIKNLTGNGHIKRKSITNTNTARYEPILHRKESQAALLRRASQAALDFESQQQPDNDSHFGSLTRSFNSALDKLDFHTQHNTHSNSSISNMRKEGETQQTPPSVEPYNPPNTPRVAARQLPPLPVLLPEVFNPVSAAAATATTTTAATGKITRTATQLHFSRDQGYQAAPATTGPGTNPLTMHTATTDMASGGSSAGGNAMGTNGCNGHAEVNEKPADEKKY